MRAPARSGWPPATGPSTSPTQTSALPLVNAMSGPSRTISRAEAANGGTRLHHCRCASVAQPDHGRGHPYLQAWRSAESRRDIGGWPTGCVAQARVDDRAAPAHRDRSGGSLVVTNLREEQIRVGVTAGSLPTPAIVSGRKRGGHAADL